MPYFQRPVVRMVDANVTGAVLGFTLRRDESPSLRLSDRLKTSSQITFWTVPLSGIIASTKGRDPSTTATQSRSACGRECPTTSKQPS